MASNVRRYEMSYLGVQINEENTQYERKIALALALKGQLTGYGVDPRIAWGDYSEEERRKLGPHVRKRLRRIETLTEDCHLHLARASILDNMLKEQQLLDQQRATNAARAREEEARYSTQRSQQTVDVATSCEKNESSSSQQSQ